MPKLPIAMGEELPNQQERIDMFIKDTRNLLISSYNKFQNQVFGITTTEGTNIMIPLDLLPGLGSTKSLSFGAFLEEEFSMKRYTKVGNLDEKQIAILNKKLNPSLNEYVPMLVKLIRRHWPLDEYDGPVTVKPWSHVMRQVSRVSARIFHSSDAAEDDHWLDIASEHVHSTVVWTENLKKWPAMLRPWVYRFVQGRGIMTQRFAEGEAVVAETLRKRKARKGGHLSSPPSLLDYLADGELGGDDVEAHTVAQINLCVAAIQSMASTVTQCLMDLATYPHYLPELREEITSMLVQKNGILDRQSLADMMKLDSFIKETQRLNPPDLASFQRKVMSDITLSNGLRIPKGARIALPTGAINMDSQFFEDPETFDGFRYYKLRMESEEARKSSQMVTVGKKDLTWGYGRHACPGRYVAEVTMKLLIIEYIVRYDIGLPAGIKERPKNIEFEGLVIPDPNWELIFQSR
ncbi:Cytochrome P450 monooxygenase ATR2 [Colletotrichum siamense]|nr:Cytochrome P450 monooxygenase ATR2 [Colletotrichum siamense]